MRLSRSRLAMLRCLISCWMVFFFAAPTLAAARSLDVVTVDVDATVMANGSVGVVEQRTYDVHGAFEGMYWDVPEGLYEGREVAADVAWVGALSDGKQVLLEEGADGAPGTYVLTDEGDYLRLKIFWPVEDETVTIQVSYELSNLASRWADVGELYWQYVKADPASEGEWQNVSCTVHLPMPDGTTVSPGDNVRAWGHGPLNGEVRFSGEAVEYFSPGVGSAEFLEARVVFPAEWLNEAQVAGEARLEGILAEEEQWAKDANAQRLKARLISYGYPGVMVVLSLGSAAVAKWYEERGRKKTPKAEFSEKYYRDVPTNDHPAVLGMLYRAGRPEGKDFAATLMCLTDQKRISLDDVWHDVTTKRGGTKREHDWRLLLHDAVQPRGVDRWYGGKKINDAAYSFLRDVIADKHKHVIDQSLMGTSGEPYVLMSFFDEVAETWPDAYSKGYSVWSDAVRAAYAAREFEKDVESDKLMPGVLGLADFVVAVVMGIAGIFLGVPNLWLCIAIIACFGAGIFIIMSDEELPAVVFSQEAVEIQAKLEALKRWLLDFTRIEEAIPSDVTLWNRLLVMATELDVADKVVEQLKVAAPDLLPRLGAWVGGAIEKDPAQVLKRSVEHGVSISHEKLYHDVSTGDLASSRDSSSGGSGGGFSSGGGGGFSGGGGRGGGF